MKGMLLIALAIWGWALFAETALFESNAVGMPLRPISPAGRKDLDYVLEVTVSGERETRRLLAADGTESRRWERLFSSGIVVEETVYRDGRKDSVKSFHPGGLPKDERVFRDGREDGRFTFEYAGAVPAAIAFTRSGDAGQYRDEYLYLPSGEFRGVRRTYDDGKIYRSVFTTLNGIPREEWHSFDGAEIVFRYDRRGSLLFQEEYRDDKLTERLDFIYAPEPPYRLAERRSRDPVLNRDAVLEYDGEGHPLRETVFESGERVALTLFTYRDNRLSRRELRRRDGREVWEYRYDEEGTLEKEFYTSGGELKKIVSFDPSPEYSRIEEYYRDGLVFLRLYFLDDKQVKSEILITETP